jgi:putative oxidoreductase
MALSSNDVKKLFSDPDLGLLIVRVILGGAMIAYGVPKFMNGGAMLEQVGTAMKFVGLDFAPVFWGFMAALTEVMGGIMIMWGFLFRPAALFLLFTMVVATLFQAHQAGSFVANAVHPLSYAGIFLGLIFTGPGKWSIQKN